MDIQLDKFLWTGGRDVDMVEPKKINVFSEVRHRFPRLCSDLNETDFRSLARTVAFRA